MIRYAVSICGLRFGFSFGAIALAVVVSACTPIRSTIQQPFPYQGASFNEAEIRVIADAYCADNTAVATPTYPYTTDGCSMVPDGDWLACCVEHDMKYWCGGGREERLAADRELKQCVASTSGSVRAQLMFLGTRLGGLPRTLFGWRWGYGHTWPFSYAEDARDNREE